MRYTTAALEAAASLSYRYIQDRFLPDKAIDLMDEAGARARIARNKAPEPVRAAEARVLELKTAMQEASEADDMNRAAELKEQVQQAEIALGEARAAWNAETGGESRRHRRAADRRYRVRHLRCAGLLAHRG